MEEYSEEESGFEDEFQQDFPYNRKELTPLQLNIQRLGQALKSHHLTPAEIASLQREMTELPGVEYLNAKVLAIALALLQRPSQRALIADINALLPYLGIQFESEEVSTRYQEAVVRYMRIVRLARGEE